MEYLYVFILMFLSIFGLTVLIKLFLGALFGSAARRFSVYVKADENTGEFVEAAHRSDFIGEINLITEDGTEDYAQKLAEQYDDIKIVGKTGR